MHKHYDFGLIIQRVGVYLIVAVAIFALDGLDFFNPIKRHVESIYVSSHSLSTEISKGLFLPWNSITQYQQNQTQIRNLQEQLAQTTVDQNQLLQLQQENQALREQLDAPLPPNWQYIATPLLGIDSDTALIGVGQAQGIVEGDALVYQDHLLGRVVSTSANMSQVRLLTHPESRVAVKVRAQTSVDGLVIGENQELVLTQILQTSEIAPDQLVVTSGTDNFLPGLVVGTIREVNPDSQAIYQQAKLATLIDPKTLQTLFIVRGME